MYLSAIQVNRKLFMGANESNLVRFVDYFLCYHEFYKHLCHSCSKVPHCLEGYCVIVIENTKLLVLAYFRWKRREWTGGHCCGLILCPDGQDKQDFQQLITECTGHGQHSSNRLSQQPNQYLTACFCVKKSKGFKRFSWYLIFVWRVHLLWRNVNLCALVIKISVILTPQRWRR